MIARSYHILSYALLPLVTLWLHRRLRLGKEDAQRIGERFGHAAVPRPAGRLIWIHAASVGESNAIVPLLQRLSDRQPDLQLLVTTGTVTSAKTIAPRLPARAIHQFIPVDLPQCVNRFLDHWQPDLGVWVESELWPNLIRMSHRRGIRMALINARMSDRSFATWRRYQGFLQSLTGCFDVLFSGSAEDAQKYQSLGVSAMQPLNNLKYDAPELPHDPAMLEALRVQIGSRPIWLASSTHEGEERMVAQAHGEMKRNLPELLSVIVPRHAVRGDAIEMMLRQQGFQVARRSKQEPVTAQTDMYLADTMGELGLFYRLCGVALIGGSLVCHGGHNPIEAAQLGCAMICGAHMDNFRGITQELLAANALIQLREDESLATAVYDMLHDEAQQDALAKAAQSTVRSKAGAVDQVVAALEPLLQQGRRI